MGVARTSVAKPPAPDARGRPALAFLIELLMAECEVHDRCRAERPVRAARSPREKSLRNFDCGPDSTIDPAVKARHR